MKKLLNLLPLLLIISMHINLAAQINLSQSINLKNEVENSQINNENLSYQKFQFNIVLSVPLLNYFYFDPKVILPQSDFGFYGFSGGIEYYYQDNRFVSLSVTKAISLYSVMIGPDFPTTNFNADYFAINNNMRINRFIIGYGLNYCRTNWKKDHDPRHYVEEDLLQDPQKLTTKSIGLNFSGHFQISKHFYAGLIYRPSVFDVYPEIRMNYGHLISFDVAYKFDISK
jgi:hypothetical protein